MAKALTYEELIEYAMKHYSKGGDVVVECWGRNEFDGYVKEVGPITKSQALRLFRLYRAQESDANCW
ncbi:MAG: hypothetical protein HFE98_06560 [Ruminiclostridium sp.]|nr:hypothetical protein [Ruminiclostridium sp.]